MPQILVVADIAEETANRVVYRERVATSDLESAHFSGQLVERVGWAVHDADAIEQQDHPNRRRSLPAASERTTSSCHQSGRAA